MVKEEKKEVVRVTEEVVRVVGEKTEEAPKSVKKAITRMKVTKDVYIIGGGLLDIGNMKRFIYLPIENKYIKEHLTKNLIDGSIASCQSESLLMIKNNLTITKGLVDYKIIPEYISVIDKLNITSSKLHLADYVLELNLI